MNEYLQLKKSNCKNCYKCIRNCPVKSIKFSDSQAYILQDECILCGICFLSCPQNAKKVRNDIEIAKKLIDSKRPVFVSIAPSFIANYDGINIKSIEKTLKKLGFFAVEETAIGATIVKTHYEKMIQENEQDVIISSCCHTVNSLIQKYYPDALKYLAKIMSPMQAHSAKIKAENPEAYTVFIGPCISKKEEASLSNGLVDCALTFEELSFWLETEKHDFLENIPEKEKTGRTRLFPTTGGIIRSMYTENTDFNYIAIDGVENCINAIKDVLAGNIKKCFIEMSACKGSCISGPVMNKNHRSPIKNFISTNNYAGENDFKITIPSRAEIKKNINTIFLKNQTPPENEIKNILSKMGKIAQQDELNCGSCGYNTCREKAIAVFNGKADLSMCLPYLKEKAESFSDKVITNTPNGIMVLNENLDIQLINDAACNIMNIKNKSDVIGCPVIRLLNPTDYVLMMTKNETKHVSKNFLAEYKKYVEETILYDQNYHIIISIMRDITEEELHKIKKEKN